MAVNLATKYSEKVNERFALGALTGHAVDTDVDFLGSKSVRFYTINTVPLTDYSRTGPNRYGNPVELQDTVQEMTMECDRAFAMTIDKGNDMDQMNAKNAARALKHQIDEVVIPELDKHRLATMAGQAGMYGALAAAPTADSIVAAVIDAGAELDDSLVPRADRTIFIMSSYYAKLKMSPEFIANDQLAGEAIARGVVGQIDGMKVVPTPRSYMPAGVYFIIVHKDAVVSPVKLEDYKIHRDPPGLSGSLCEGRFYFDCFVVDAKRHGIYAAVESAKALAAPTATVSGGNLTVSNVPSGATAWYTLNGTDPRTPDNKAAKAYSAAVPLTGIEGETTIRVAAIKDGSFPSNLVKVIYKP